MASAQNFFKIAESEFLRVQCTNFSPQLSRGNDSALVFYQRRGYTEKSPYELFDKMLRDG